MREVYIMVDCEFDGPIPGDYSMLAFDARCIDDPEIHFYRELKPISEHFVDSYHNVCRQAGLNRNYLAGVGTDPAVAMADFAEWIADVCDPDGAPVFVAIPGSPDWLFTAWYFHHFFGSNPFGFKGLCMESYYAGLENIPFSKATLSRMRRDMEINSLEFPHTHDPRFDTAEQAEITRRVFDKNERRSS